MSIDRKEQTLPGVVLGLIVRLGGIPVVDQQAILVGKVVNKVVFWGRIAEEVGTDLQGIISYASSWRREPR